MTRNRRLGRLGAAFATILCCTVGYGEPPDPTDTPTYTPTFTYTYTYTPTHTHTYTHTPTLTPTPVTTPPNAVWQYPGWTTGSNQDIDDALDSDDPLRVFWPRYVGDHLGQVVRRAEDPVSTPVFLPYPTQPLVRLYNTGGAVQTPIPWQTPVNLFWGFDISAGEKVAGREIYWKIDALSNKVCYEFPGLTVSAPYPAAYRDLGASGPNFAGDTEITMEALVKADVIEYRHIANVGTGGDPPGTLVSLNIWDNGQLGAKIRTNYAGGTEYRADSAGGGDVSQGNWHHVALVWGNNQLRAYVDGVGGTPVATSGSLYDFSTALKLWVGCWHTWYKPFDGMIDEFCISDVARSPEEFVLRGPHVVDSHVALLWQLSEGSGTVLADSSGYGYGGTIVNGSKGQWANAEGFGKVVGSVNDYADPVTQVWQGGLTFATHTPTITPTPTQTFTPKTTPPEAVWQYRGWTSGSSEDIDLASETDEEVRVFWPRYVGDHFGWIIRKAIDPQSTPVFQPYGTPPAVNLYNTSGAVQTPVPWQTPGDLFWGFGLSGAELQIGHRLYWEIDALSNKCCYDFNGTGFATPYSVAAYTGTYPDYNSFSGLSVEALIQTDSVADRQTIVWIFSSGTSVAVNLELRYVTDHLELAGMFRESGGTTRVLSGGTIQIGQWYHVALVWDGSAVTLSVDGSSVDSANSTGPIYDADSYYTRIGAYGTSYYGFDGRIDEVRISSVAHDPEEFVLRGPAKADAGTEFLFHFSDGAGAASLHDSSGHNRHMSISNFTSQEWTSDDGFGEVAGSISDYADPVTETWQGGLEVPTYTPTPTSTPTPTTPWLKNFRYLGDQDSDGGKDIHPR